MCESYDVVVGHSEEEWLVPPSPPKKSKKYRRATKGVAAIIIVRGYHSNYTPEQFNAWEIGE